MTNSDRSEPGPIISGAQRGTIHNDGGRDVVTTWTELTDDQLTMATDDPARLDRHLTALWRALILQTVTEPGAVYVDTLTGSAVIPPVGHITGIDVEVRLRRQPDLSHIAIRVEHVT